MADARRSALRREPAPFLLLRLLLLVLIVGIVVGDWLGLNALFLGLVSYIPLSRWAAGVVKRELQRLIAAEGTHCEKCGYLLLGNRSGRCPECGTAIPAEQRRLILLKSDWGVEIDPPSGVELESTVAGAPRVTA